MLTPLFQISPRARAPSALGFSTRAGTPNDPLRLVNASHETLAQASELTLEAFLDMMENVYKVDCSMVSCGTALCYFSFGNAQKMNERRKMSIKTMVSPLEARTPVVW